jgi:hypothetical protein
MLFNEEAPSHDGAQVCLNGHVINDAVHWSPERNQKFCAKCGQPTITTCQQCNAEIRGRESGSTISVGVEYLRPPSFCQNCGKSFPWTDRRLQAAKDLADELDELDQADRDKLKASLDDLAKDSPQTEVAASRFKKIMGKVGTQAARMMQSIVTDVLSETAKKMLSQ